jgi:hypothetical protein
MRIDAVFFFYLMLQEQEHQPLLVKGVGDATFDTPKHLMGHTLALLSHKLSLMYEALGCQCMRP